MAATKRRMIGLLTLLVLGLLLSITVVLFLRERDQAIVRFESLFENRVSDAVSRISVHMDRLGGVLRGLQGFYAGTESVNRAEFSRYVQELQVELNLRGVQGVGFALALRTPSEREALVSKVRSEGYSQFVIAPTPADDAFSSAIVFLEPFAGRNLRAFGFDMFSEEVRRQAMERAWLEDTLALSGRVTLVQETSTNRQAGTLLYAPIFKNGSSHATLEDRKQNLVGWVYMPLRMDDLMGSVLAPSEGPRDIEVRIYDGDASSDQNLLHRQSTEEGVIGPTGSIGPAFKTASVLELYGRSWTLEFQSLPALERNLSYSKAYAILVVGILLSLLVVFVIALLVGREERAHQLALARTKDLHKKQIELQTERDNVNLLLSAIAAGVIKFNRSGIIVSMNAAAQTMLGDPMSKSAGAPLSVVWPGCDIDFASPQPKSFESGFVRSDGREILVSGSCTWMREASGESFAILTFTDVTERRQIEEQLEQQRALALSAAKMASLGVMAGGIAHEINTPLAVIQSRANRLIEIISQRNQPEQSDVLLGIQKIEITAKRIASIVRGLQAFSRDSKQDPKSVVNLSSLFADVRQICHEKTQNLGVTVSFDCVQDVEILGRQEQFLQIMVNLINNALDAVRELPERWVRVIGEVHGQRVLIIVIDSGHGIPSHAVEKIMDPFFTTKPVGKGTGLGLSISLGIAREHGGDLRYVRGQRHTTFVLELPVHSASGEQSDLHEESA